MSMWYICSATTGPFPQNGNTEKARPGLIWLGETAFPRYCLELGRDGRHTEASCYNRLVVHVS